MGKKNTTAKITEAGAQMFTKVKINCILFAEIESLIHVSNPNFLMDLSATYRRFPEFT